MWNLSPSWSVFVDLFSDFVSFQSNRLFQLPLERITVFCSKEKVVSVGGGGDISSG